MRQRPASLTWWSYGRRASRGRICIRFECRHTYEVFSPRWRSLAEAVWNVVVDSPGVAFHDVPVDISDCVDGTLPPDTLRFAKLPGDPHDLIPNAHLLGRRKRIPPALPWESKRDSLYFRGTLTGGDSAANPRVVACMLARREPCWDCKLTGFPSADEAFIDELVGAGIVAPRDRPSALNGHRYVLDVDGHSSSWDRYYLTGRFGGVPVRFETKWVEFWHVQATAGEHYVAADRHTLRDEIEDLRSRPARARAIRDAASALVESALSPAAVQKAFRSIWLRRAA